MSKEKDKHAGDLKNDKDNQTGELKEADLEKVSGGSGGTANLGHLGSGGPGPSPKNP